MASDDRNDNDILTGPVPAPDAEPTSVERAGAKTFAELVDKTLAGRTPPAMSADARALLEVATVIRAANGKAELDRNKQRSIVEDALARAIGGTNISTTGNNVTAITAARARRRWVPWAVAGTSTLVAAAAMIALWVRKPAVIEVPVNVQAAEVPMTWRSRPADVLVGPIDRAEAGNAVGRIDRIFDNRLYGYRERLVTRGGK
jgi:hypothetical protein